MRGVFAWVTNIIRLCEITSQNEDISEIEVIIPRVKELIPIIR